MENTYAAGVGLDVDTPLGRIEVERLESTLPAQHLELVDPLVATVVPRIRETLRVLVRKNGAVGLHDGLTRQILENVSVSSATTGARQRTSEAMSSSPENCLHVSLSMMFLTSGSISARGA